VLALVAVASALTLGVVALGWYTTVERYDDDAIVVRGQPGVTPASFRAAREGAHLALRWVDATGDVTVRGPVDIRLANRGKCLWIESLDSSAWSGTDLTGDDFICVYTRPTFWRERVAGDAERAVEVIAHETIHHAQRSLGCVDGPGHFRFQWFVEGMATWGAAQALVEGGVWTTSEAERHRDGDGAPPEAPLSAFEQSGDDGAYSLGRLAVADLAARASARGLWQFCSAVGRGADWHEAFRASFGTTVGDFYASFDQRNH
jgi:hypothetical protein